ncbi:hypothetical protein ROHU_030021 [Labeo rohita]|uniref:Uncharacterized protein n=1 Tax=Labeo rohita TaxID=84645 RepID=A0A498LX29_LABRO|nr:hypothetical protein ROHU_030021 [Labeo rohita]
MIDFGQRSDGHLGEVNETTNHPNGPNQKEISNKEILIFQAKRRVLAERHNSVRPGKNPWVYVGLANAEI